MKLSPTATRAAPQPLAPDPAATARLIAALDVVLAASDAVSKAVRAFNALDPADSIPDAWVARAVELHVALLAAWWALDDEAAVDAAAGGWTVGPPHAIGTPVERRLIRLKWETEWFKPAGPALWWDRATVSLKVSRTEKEVELAGRALVAEGSRRRYSTWHEHATREATNE